MKYYQAEFHLMPYREVVADMLTALLGDCGFEAFVPATDGFTGYVQQREYDEASVRQAVATFQADCQITYTVTEAPDEDWNQAWEDEGFEPIAIDRLVCVHDTRHTDVPSCRYDIIVNPRMAFGTGTHPTTQQILRQLCQTELQGRAVVDAGCGTGVLGFLCSMRGASSVFAYDIDEWSVENTRINAGLNGIDNIDVREGDASVLPQDGRFDLLIANINRNILLNDMPRFACALNQHGQMLLSGFYDADVALLLDKGKELGFGLELQTVVNGWAMLLLRRLVAGL